LKGIISQGADNFTEFTLPAGYRPTQQRMFVGLPSVDSNRIDIQIDVKVTVYITSGNWISLAGISF
jgi:hypothetical protein